MSDGVKRAFPRQFHASPLPAEPSFRKRACGPELRGADFDAAGLETCRRLINATCVRLRRSSLTSSYSSPACNSSRVFCSSGRVAVRGAAGDRLAEHGGAPGIPERFHLGRSALVGGGDASVTDRAHGPFRVTFRRPGPITTNGTTAWFLTRREAAHWTR